MHIAFFDSGLGGLSVVREVFNHPDIDQLGISACTYIADTGAFPYGDKPAAWLSQRIGQVVQYAMVEEPAKAPDLMVIACNTASTLVLKDLRERFTLPFVGVVPAIKPAAAISRSKHVGLLATPETVARDYTAQLISDFAPHCQVSLHGSTELVRLAENKLLTGEVDLEHLKQETWSLLSEHPMIDTVVLACTHFPLLSDELHGLYPHIRWIDSGEAIARRILQISKPATPHDSQQHYSHQQSSQQQNSQQQGSQRHNPQFQTEPHLQLMTTGGSMALHYAQQWPQLAKTCGVFEHITHTPLNIPLPLA